MDEWRWSEATIERSRELSKILRENKEVKAVFLFGSTARDGFGRDFDLIIISSEEVFREFVRMLGSFEEHRSAVNSSCQIYKYKMNRLRAARNALAKKYDRNYAQELTACPDSIRKVFQVAHPVHIDLFIFPEDWRDRLSFLQSTLPNKDPRFMENIVDDATLI
jgi:predicted nucleotidyltransferase